MELKTTPLVKEHERLGAKFAPFGGWLMPISYKGIIEEHNWTRKSASIFDICHMGEFIISGKNSKNSLNKIITMNLDDTPVYSCRYGFILNKNGGIIDDLIVYKVEEEKYMIVVNAATTENNYKHIRSHLPENVKMKNISDITAKIDLQGPLSKDILKELIDRKVESLDYYTFSCFSVLGEDIIISRTGYTGELGYEFYINKDKTKELWNMLLKNERVRPAGLGARDTLRLEMGYPLYSQDINENVTPEEAGLGKFVDFNKDFIGKDALLERKEKGITKKLVSFIVSSRRTPRHNYKIYSNEKEIGIVTSGSFSPSLSCGIGMGYVADSYSKVGTKLILGDDRVKIDAAISKRPFYREGSLRK